MPLEDRIMFAGMRRTLVLFAVLIGLLATTTAANAQPYDLRWNVAKGEVLWIQSTTKQNIQTDANGQKMDMQQNMLFTCKLTVKDIEAGNIYVMDVLVDRFSMEMKAPQMTMMVDSSKPETLQGPLGPVAQALKGAHFIAKMDSKGKVKEVSGLEGFLQKLLASTSQNDPNAGALVGKMLDPKAIQKSIEQSTASFPENPVNIGDEWTQKMDLPVGMPMSIDTTYRLEKVDSQTITISRRSKITTAEKGADINQGDMAIHMEMSGTDEGTMVLDRTTMMLQRMDSVQDIDMTTTTSMPGKDPMKIPMTIHSVQTVEARR